MEKYTPLTTLATNPSNFDAPDGQLASCVNLICEDGALRPVYMPDDEEFLVGNSSCTILYTHVGSDFKNYIIFCEVADGDSNQHFFYISAKEVIPYSETDFRHPLSVPDSIDYKDGGNVASIGTVLVISSRRGTIRFFWDGNNYERIGNFTYDLAVTSMKLNILDNGSFSPDGNKSFGVTASLEDNPISVTQGRISDSESVEIYNALVAKLNSLIAEDDSRHIFRGTSFGVVALQMYDTSYIAISDPFILAPRLADGLDNCTVTGVVRDEQSVLTSVSAGLAVAKYRISVNMGLSSGISPALKKLISGAVVFVTRPVETWKTDEVHTITSLPGDNQYQLKYKKKSEEDLYKEIDSLSFFRSTFIPLKGLEAGSPSYLLETVTGAEEHLSLADFRRTTFNAGVSFVYNNRLHIADISKDYSSVLSIAPMFVLPAYEQPEGSSDPLNGTEGQMLSKLVYGWFINGSYASMFQAPAKAVVTFNDGKAILLIGYVPWPLPPMVTFPDGNAEHLSLYVDLSSYKPPIQPNLNYPDYINVELDLRQSQGFGMAYHLFLDDKREFRFIQDTEYNSISVDMYNDVDSDYQQEHADDTPERTNNLLRYSEAENPFVFPVNNYVAVGSADIVAMATSTQPISEGQFGVAPLYVFTTDATWALSVNDDGRYSAQQPATRDVIINARSVTSIDNAVLFATERGIMLIQGNKATCISEALDGSVFSFCDQMGYRISSRLMEKTLNPPHTTYDDARIWYLWQVVGRRDFKESYLPYARMAYDYASQRLVVFKPDEVYAYVYSFKSGMWGAAENTIHDVVPDYPVMRAVINGYNGLHYGTKVEVGTWVDLEPRVFAATRPFKLGEPFSFKTIKSIILRGDFYPRNTIVTALFGSNDLSSWQLVNSSADHKLRGKLGNPYKYYILAFGGMLEGSHGISGFHTDYFVRWNNQIR